MAASLCAVGQETYFRLYGQAGYFSCWPVLPLIFLLNYSLYRLIITTPILDSFILFSFCTSTLRLGAAWLIGDPILARNLLPYLLIIIANILRRLL